MTELVDLLADPRTFGAVLLVFGLAPGFVLRLVVRAYPQADERRAELLNELDAVPWYERPIWVFQQIECAICEGLPARYAKWAANRDPDSDGEDAAVRPPAGGVFPAGGSGSAAALAPVHAGTRGYGGPAVCRVVGITYRQLDYWATTGLVEPSLRDPAGSGSQRLYSFEDIVTLKVIKRLLDVGVSLQRIRRAIDYVRDRGVSLRNLSLASDGETVYAATDGADVVDLLRRGQGVFAIAVDPLYDETEADVTALLSESATPSSTDEGEDKPNPPTDS